jgi:hypothetical protein
MKIPTELGQVKMYLMEFLKFIYLDFRSRSKSP